MPDIDNLGSILGATPNDDNPEPTPDPEDSKEAREAYKEQMRLQLTRAQILMNNMINGTSGDPYTDETIPQAQRIINYASDQVGILGNGSLTKADNPTGKFYDIKGESSFSFPAHWCRIFVTHCARAANIPQSVIGRASTCSRENEGSRTGVNPGEVHKGEYYALSQSEIYTPRVGDLIMFTNASNPEPTGWSNYGASHVAIVSKVDAAKKKLEYIGGNQATQGTTDHPGNENWKVWSGVTSKRISFTNKVILSYYTPTYNVVPN